MSPCFAVFLIRAGLSLPWVSALFCTSQYNTAHSILGEESVGNVCSRFTVQTEGTAFSVQHVSHEHLVSWRLQAGYVCLWAVQPMGDFGFPDCLFFSKTEEKKPRAHFHTYCWYIYLRGLSLLNLHHASGGQTINCFIQKAKIIRFILPPVGGSRPSSWYLRWNLLDFFHTTSTRAH